LSERTVVFLTPLAEATRVPGSGIEMLSVAVPRLRFFFSFPIVKKLRALTRIVPALVAVLPTASVAVALTP
jgi:hypothetical protein